MTPKNIIIIIVSAQGFLLLIAVWFCIRILKNRINLQEFKDEIKSYSPHLLYEGCSSIHKILQIVKNNSLKGRSLHHDELTEVVYLEQTKYDSWINSLVNSEIVLGLLGTFIGIILALNKIDPSNIVKSSDPTVFIDALTGRIEPFLKGFLVASTSSLFGIISTLAGRFIFQSIRQYRERNIREVLLIVNTDLLPLTASERSEDKIYQSVQDFSQKVEDLTKRIETQLIDFNTRFDDLVNKTTNAFQETFKMIVDENKIALDKQVQSLEDSTNSLNESRRDIADKLVDISAKSGVQVQSLSDIQRRMKEETEAFESARKDYHQKEEEIINRLAEYSGKQKELMEVYGDNFKGLAELGEQAVENQKKTNETLNGLGKTMTENIAQINQKHFEILDEIEKRILKNITDLNDIFQQKTTDFSENLDIKRKEIFDEYMENLKKLGEIGQTSAENIAIVNQKTLDTVGNMEIRIATNHNELTLELSEKLGAISAGLDNKHKEIFDEYKKHLEKLDQLETLSEQNLNASNGRIFKGIEDIEKRITVNFNDFSSQLNKNALSLLEKFEEKHQELQTGYKENFQTLGSLGNTFADNIKEIREAVFNSVDEIQNRLAVNLKDISRQFNQNFGNLLAGFNDRHKEVNDKYMEHLVKLNELGDLSGKNLKTLEDTIYKNLRDIEVQITENITLLTRTFKDNLEKIGELNRQFPSFITSMQETAGGIKATVNGFDLIVDRFRQSISDDVKKYFNTIEISSRKLDGYFKDIKDKIDTFGNIQEYGNKMMDRFDGTVNSFGQPLQELHKILDNFRLVVNLIQDKFVEKQESMFKKILEQEKIPINLFLASNGYRGNDNNNEQEREKNKVEPIALEKNLIAQVEEPNRAIRVEKEPPEKRIVETKEHLKSKPEASSGNDIETQKNVEEKPEVTSKDEKATPTDRNFGETGETQKEEKPNRGGVFKAIAVLFKRKTPKKEEADNNKDEKANN